MAKPMFSSIESILQAFETFAKSPYWSLWKGTQLITSYDEDGGEEASKEKLTAILEALYQNDNNDLFTLKFHSLPEGGEINNKTKYYASIYVRVNENRAIDRGEQYYRQPRYLAPANQVSGLDEIKTLLESKLTSIEDRIKALEELEPEGGEEYEEFTDAGLTGAIAGIERILKIPLVAKIAEHPAVIGYVTNLLSKIPMANTPKEVKQVAGLNQPAHVPGTDNATPQTQPQGGAQVSEEEQLTRLNAALAKLAPHCNLVEDFEKLAALAENEPGTFQMLLSMLRTK